MGGLDTEYAEIDQVYFKQYGQMRYISCTLGDGGGYRPYPTLYPRKPKEIYRRMVSDRMIVAPFYNFGDGVSFLSMASATLRRWILPV